MLNMLGFWLRWSWRDLRARWVQVTVVALIIALGIAVYAGLGSTTPWRQQSTDASYELLNVYDLHVTFATGTYVEQDALLQTVRSVEHADWIAAAEPRLIADTFVNVPTPQRDILVRGKLYGVDVTNGGPHINGIHVDPGRALNSQDAGQAIALLEYHFADYYDLPASGSLALSGGVALDYVGHAMTPEFFMITTPEGGMWAQASFAAVITSLETAQQITGHAGRVNDLLLDLNEGADRERIEQELAQAFETQLPGAGFTFKTRADDTIYRVMQQSIHMNQQIYDLMIALFLAGASFGAFNLASRLVEAQRRQIGIGMALGMSPRLLVIRPLLVGAQIAVLGVLFGLGLGALVGKLAEVWMRDLLPLPVMGDLFQFRTFVQAAAIGFMLPFAATAYPVWRAVRVTPVEAITTGYLIEKQKNGRWITLGMQLPVTGKSFVQMPIRNLLRSPRRTLLTVLGIASAIITLIGLVGVIDSVNLALDNIRQEAYQDHPDRMTVFLNNFYPLDAPQITALRESDALTHAVPAIRVPGHVQHGDVRFNVLVEALPLGNDLWTPTLVEGASASNSGKPGVIISRSAALDLGVSVGDTITLEHPYREGLLAYQMKQSQVQITGLHADRWRTYVYLDQSQADIMQLEGMANIVEVNPQSGLRRAEARTTLFGYDGVASVISVRETIESTEGVLREAIRFMSGVQVAALALAFLIAFSSTNIGLSERAREIATMFAFGLPVRTVTRMAMLENLITGILGTLIGTGLGLVFLVWFLTQRMMTITPELRYPITLSPTTLLLALLTGIMITTLTPLLYMRRMLAMDVPSALRVME